jgi:hypothetical protein
MWDEAEVKNVDIDASQILTPTRGRRTDEWHPLRRLSAMDPAVVSALSAVLGSVVGGSASIATAWFTQKTQGRRELVRAEIRKREVLYAEFISECSKLALDSLDHTLEHAETLVNAYAFHNRIRLISSDAVVDAAAQAIRRILERYVGPNITKEELRTLVLSLKDDEDPLKVFSEACRNELAKLQYWA